MAWPTPREYSLALNKVGKKLPGPGLAGCEFQNNPQGLPKPQVGGFGAVFEATTPDGRRWALKFFHKKALGTRRRYRLLADWQKIHPMPGLVSCVWHEKAILVRGKEYPMVQMPWIEGVRLSDFLAKHHDSPAVCDVLLDCWLKLMESLRTAGIAHGDLQHNNILLVPEGGNRFQMRLVDLDGFWLPDLKDIPSSEIGHKAYQHPFRANDPYHQFTDRFPALVIALSLMALTEHGGNLWRRFHIGRNLIFRRSDFLNPHQSPLFLTLRASGSERVRKLSLVLEGACTQSPDQIPWVGELLGGKKIDSTSLTETDTSESPQPLEPRQSPSFNQRFRKFTESPWVGALAGMILATTLFLACLVPVGVSTEIKVALPTLIVLGFTALPFALMRIFRKGEGLSRPFPATISPMGRWIAAGYDCALVVWDTKSGFKARWRAHDQQILCAAFHPDGLHLASGAADNTLRIWHAGTCDLLGEMKGHAWSVVACAWSNDGNLLASASGDKTVRVWDPETYAELACLNDGAEKMVSLAFSRDCNWLVTGGHDRQWRLYNTRTWKLERSAPAHPRVVSAIAFSQDGLRFATGGDDGRIQLWAVSSGKRQKSFKAHDGLIAGLAFGSTDTRIYSAGTDGCVRAWDAGNTTEIHSTTVCSQPLTCLEMDPRGDFFITASDDARVHKINAIKGKVTKRWSVPGSTHGVEKTNAQQSE